MNQIFIAYVPWICYSYYKYYWQKENYMKIPYELRTHLCRFCKAYSPDAPEVPAELFSFKAQAPELSDFPCPLPSKKSDYTCFARQGSIVWYGGKSGLTRYDPNAEREEDIIMYFSARRDLRDNNVKAIVPIENGVWVLTDTAASKIEMLPVTAEEKSEMLRRETLDYVERRGMVSQRNLHKPYAPDSRYYYAHSDNDGGFTACYGCGEIFRFAALLNEKGASDPRTVEARKCATRAVEACLLLMYIPGRGDGFVARSYGCSDEPVPDDGYFLQRKGDKAVLLETSRSKHDGNVGTEVYCGAPIPERLAKLYRDLGYTDDDIYYKADTSSDEITLHFLQLYFANKYLAPDDPELGELIKDAAKNILGHIIDHGYELHDFTGKPTTWAKWSLDYFATEDGWVDGCLNAAEVLSYHRIVMDITGEEGRWKESYEHLINDLGYADLTEKHFDRLYQVTIAMGSDYPEEIMYGDHMLAVASYWMLCTLEKDETLLKKYRKGFAAWKSSIAHEHNPGYDIPYMLSCPDDEVDMEKLATWFYRFNVSRLAAGVSLRGRHDIPYKTLRTGYEQIPVILPPDETFIAKYDRDPLEYKNSDSCGEFCIESCYPYTFAYWLGRLNGLFE